MFKGTKIKGKGTRKLNDPVDNQSLNVLSSILTILLTCPIVTHCFDIVMAHF